MVLNNKLLMFFSVLFIFSFFISVFLGMCPKRLDIRDGHGQESLEVISTTKYRMWIY